MGQCRRMANTVTSSATSTAIDLSRLPPPDIIEALDFETVLDALKSDFTTRLPDFTAMLESDPVLKLLEAFAYRELLLRQRINEAARACMVAFARNADLDQLAAFYGVTRKIITPADQQAGMPAILEGDEDMRRRVLLAPDSFSVAGPAAAYVFHALAASGDVADVATTSPAPGEVVISVLSRFGDGGADQSLLDEVEARVSADDIRPLTDEVTVRSAEIVPFAVDAQLTLYPGPDASLILATAQSQLVDLLARNRRVGRDITRSAIFAALHVAGVQNINLISPSADIRIDGTQAAYAAAVSVTVSGTDE